MYGTQPLGTDSDSDGVQDGTELGLTVGTLDTSGTFKPDMDPATTTDPRRDDSDDDGLEDGEEDNGAGAGNPGDGWFSGTETNPLDMDTDDDGLCDGVCGDLGEDTDTDGVLDSGESDPRDWDSDDDGLSDGVEKGAVAPVRGTDITKFAPDQDPNTLEATDPRSADSDGVLE